MTGEEIKGLFVQGIDCSQVVVGRFTDELGVEESLLGEMSTCFRDGMQCGRTCGTMTGAPVVIGLRYEHSGDSDLRQKEVVDEKTSESKCLFADRCESCMCRELLRYDTPKTGEMERVLEQGLLFDLCPRVMRDIIEIPEKVV